MAERIIDKILWIEGFYPFSLKYNQKKAIDNHIKDLNHLEMDETSKSIFQYSNYFNLYFKDICAVLDKTISKSTLNKLEFIQLIIADLNRTELLVDEESKKTMFSGSSIDSNMPANVYITKSEFQNNSEPAWGLIDNAIDTANLNLNYLNYVKFKKTTVTTDELSQVNVIKNLTRIGSLYNVIKQAYDKIIWRSGTIEFTDSTIKLQSSQQQLMLDNIALTRLIRNIIGVKLELQNDLSKHNSIRKHFHSTRNFTQLKSIEVGAKDIRINYQKKSKDLSESYAYCISPILTYYPFIHTEKISEFDNLTIIDLVNLLSLLRDFIINLPIPKYTDTEVKDLTKFSLFNPKIKKSKLKEHLKKITKYSEKQILIFLNLLTQRGDKHNLFQHSIYEAEDYYFFSHSTIKRANILYLVDKWLHEGRYDLAKRGYKFEEYIKTFLANEKLNEFAQCKVIEQSKFYFSDEANIRKEEEIDLVIKTENSIIIGEVKCATYLLEPSDYYTAYQTITKAKNQVTRKAKFLEENWGMFEHILGKKDSMKIQKIIILNFPHFTGTVIDGIPVVDFYLFLSYFKSGKLSNMKLEKDKGITINEVKYYDSTQSFEENFSQFFTNPIPIKDLLSRQKIEEYEVTISGTEPKTIAERVIYVEKSQENET